VYAEKTPEATRIEHTEKLATQDAEVAKFDASIDQLLSLMGPEQRTTYWEGLIADAKKALAKEQAGLDKTTKKLGDAEPAKKVKASIDAAQEAIATIQADIDGMLLKMGQVSLSDSTVSKNGSGSA
jgi:hypothetical protein